MDDSRTTSSPPDTAPPDGTPADHVRIRALDGPGARANLERLTDLLVDCVEGGASVGFLWPLSRERALMFWKTVADAVMRGERALMIAEDDDALIGTVQLLLAQPDNQPHRADLAKLLVLRRARRRGVALRLLARAELAARAAGKDLLVLDTVTGGDAEQVYLRAGWQPVGSIPRYALMPDGAPCATTVFWKSLA